MIKNYEGIQRELRRQVKILLARRPPTITYEEYEDFFSDVKNKEKVCLRIFTKKGGELEWKLNVSDRDLDQIYSPTKGKLRLLYNRSHNIRNRTKYPYIAPANKRGLICDSSNMNCHTYGFDLLIRPPMISDEFRTGERNLNVGELSFAFIIYVTLNLDGIPTTPDAYYVRAAWGQELSRCGLWGNLSTALEGIESEVYRCLNVRDYEQLAIECIEIANKAASLSVLV